MRKLIAGLLLLLALTTPLWAQFYPITQPDSTFSCALVNIAATLTQCQAVPTASAPGGITPSYYITDIAVQSTTATSGTYAIQSGTGANCGTNTTAVFPKSSTSDRFNQSPNTAAITVIAFTTPLRLTAGHAVCVIGVATNTTSIQIGGYVK